MTIEQAEKQGYSFCKVLKFNGKDVIAGLIPMMYTVGLAFGIDNAGYYGRYCFPKATEAKACLDSITEIPDDLMLDNENWIKYKGYGGDIHNPKY